METSKRFKVAAVPLIQKVIERIDLENLLKKHISTHPNEKFHAVHSLLILIFNLTIRKNPLYEVGKWLSEYDERGFSSYPQFQLSDDRLARALDKLYNADRASIMTEVIVKAIREFDISTAQIHNDSTTVKAYGKYQSKSPSGLELKRGHSKDHRPDLKQLLYSLSVSSDGFVPIHYKVYSGNVTDDTTHIETWDTIRNIIQKSNFIYVADCKVCTEKQLDHIVKNGGRVVTVVPKTWGEDKSFRNVLRSGKKISKKIIWKKRIEHYEEDKEVPVGFEYFSLFLDSRKTSQGYSIYWIYSNRKEEKDRERRERNIERAEQVITSLIEKVNTRKLKEENQIKVAIDKILKKYSVRKFFTISIEEEEIIEKKQLSPGRPSKDTKYREITRSKLLVSCKRDKKAIRAESRTDGVFPLLSTDDSLKASVALKAYKQQPRLEKRFSQFKSVHMVAPLFYKKVSRIEATMFLFFLSLLIQALIERDVRRKMKEEGVEYLSIYPEGRSALSPTTSKIFDYFETVGISKAEGKEFIDVLGPTQKQILGFLGVTEKAYWGSDSR